MRLAVSLLLLATASFPAMAQASPAEEPSGYSPRYDACMASGDAAQGVTAGLVNCTRQEIDRQYGRLNRAYRAAMTRLDPAQRRTLKIAQRKWLKSHDKICVHEARDEEGGTTWLILYNNCMLAEVKSRADFVEHYRKPRHPGK